MFGDLSVVPDMENKEGDSANLPDLREVRHHHAKFGSADVQYTLDDAK